MEQTNDKTQSFHYEEDFEKWKQIAEFFCELWTSRLTKINCFTEENPSKFIFNDKEVVESAIYCINFVQTDNKPSCIQIYYGLMALKTKYPNFIKILEFLEKWCYYHVMPEFTSEHFEIFIKKINDKKNRERKIQEKEEKTHKKSKNNKKK